MIRGHQPYPLRLYQARKALRALLDGGDEK